MGLSAELKKDPEQTKEGGLLEYSRTWKKFNPTGLCRFRARTPTSASWRTRSALGGNGSFQTWTATARLDWAPASPSRDPNTRHWRYILQFIFTFSKKKKSLLAGTLVGSGGQHTANTQNKKK